MACPEERIIAFLAGDLSPQEERLFDEHLLGCEECWAAVQANRVASAALERLREPAPDGLGDRVAMAVALAANDVRPSDPPPADTGDADAPGSEVPVVQVPVVEVPVVEVPVVEVPVVEVPGAEVPRAEVTGAGAARMRDRGTSSRRGRRRRAGVFATASAFVAVAAGVLGWVALSPGATKDPAQVAAVMAMVSPRSVPSSALRAGEKMSVGGQSFHVQAYEYHGAEVVVATSAAPFPLLSRSKHVANASPGAWAASRGRVSVYGVNEARGNESMLLAAAMPVKVLPQVAAELHLS